MMKEWILTLRWMFLLLAPVNFSMAQAISPGANMAATIMEIWQDSFSTGSRVRVWSSDIGLVLKGMETLWLNTGDARYFHYIEKMMSGFVNEDGSIRGYREDEYNLEVIQMGDILLTLYRVTGKEKYIKAATQLRRQLQHQPRTTEGVFWQKKTESAYALLQGLNAAGPFYAQFAGLFHEDTAFNDIANQFLRIWQPASDPKRGFLNNAKTVSGGQPRKKNATADTSAFFRARSTAWYAPGLVDALEHFPSDHPRRQELLKNLAGLVDDLEKQQHPSTGLWYNELDYDGNGKNFFDVSVACLFVYTVAKAVRSGYLPYGKINIAQKAWKGIHERFVKEEKGRTFLINSVKAEGAPGNPQGARLPNQVNQPQEKNHPEELGAYLLAVGEMELAATVSFASGKVVMLDRYFNSEMRKDLAGRMGYWHYTWEERTHPGFHVLGHIFKRFGAKLTTLDSPPALESLSKASVYILVDPDHTKDNPRPNYMTDAYAAVIADWVYSGGVLLLMANDSSNCDLKHLNKLASRFSFSFNSLNLNMVKDDHFPTGNVIPDSKNMVFRTAEKMFLKEICGLDISNPAIPLVQKDGNVLMSVVRYGKGVVFAVGDPWLYNEYVDGRKLPVEYENYAAAEDLAAWLLKQARAVVP